MLIWKKLLVLKNKCLFLNPRKKFRDNPENSRESFNNNSSSCNFKDNSNKETLTINNSNKDW